jgi:hypothetical protein
MRIGFLVTLALCLIFWETVQLFSEVLTLFCIDHSIVQGFYVLHIPNNACYIPFNLLEMRSQALDEKLFSRSTNMHFLRYIYLNTPQVGKVPAPHQTWFTVSTLQSLKWVAIKHWALLAGHALSCIYMLSPNTFISRSVYLTP